MADSKNMSAYGSFNNDLQQQQLKDLIDEYQLYKKQKNDEQLDDDELTQQVTNSYDEENSDLYEQNAQQEALRRMRERIKYGE